jgi:hypothetical protein
VAMGLCARGARSDRVPRGRLRSASSLVVCGPLALFHVKRCGFS